MSDDSSHQSVTLWLSHAKQGDSISAQKIWNRYYASLVRQANRVLGGKPLRLGDADDVVSIAFRDFLKCVESNRFPQLEDRGDLWQILMMITERKAKDFLTKENAKKRGDDLLVGESAVSPKSEDMDTRPSMDYLPINEPTPEFALEIAERLRILFDKLGDPRLVEIAKLKMEGYLETEISERVRFSLRTVERKLKLIRDIWKNDWEEVGGR